MTWDVEYTDEFGDWWSGLSEEEQEALDSSVRLLEERGPALGFPHSSGVGGSKHGHMRELRTQAAARGQCQEHQHQVQIPDPYREKGTSAPSECQRVKHA